MDTVYIQNLPLVIPSELDKVVLSQNGNTRNATVESIRGIINDLITGGITKTLSAEAAKLFKIYVDEELDKRYLKTESFTQEEVIQKINDLVGALINNSPEALNTLKELADALGDDANFATTITNLLANKVDKDGVKVLSDHNYGDTDKNKVDTIIITGAGTKYHNDAGGYSEVVAGSGNATSINDKFVDNSTWAHGRVLTANSVTGKDEWATITPTGIVGSTGNLVPAGSNISIPALSEAIFTHTASTNDKIMINVQQQVIGSSVTDTHVDFSDASKYALQDSKTIGMSSNKLTLLKSGGLDDNTIVLLKGEGTNGSTTIVDSSLSPKTITNTGVTNNTTNKKIGVGSLYFNGSSYMNVTGTSTDFDFNIGNWMLEFWIKLNENTDKPIISSPNYSYTNSTGWAMSYSASGWFNLIKANNGVDYRHAYIPVLSDLSWHHIRVIKNGTALGILLDGVIKTTDTYLTGVIGTTNGFNIGEYEPTNTSKLNAYIDNFRFERGIFNIEAYTPPSMEYYTYLNNTPLFLKTTGTSDYSLTTTSSITSISSTVTIPTNTSVKVLFSVDNGVNYLYKDGTGIHKYTGDLTIAWTSSNQWSEISTYFTNLSIATLTSDLASLGIAPITLDFIFQLNTTDNTVTPSIGKITLVYVETSHTELASFGGYSESTMFGVKIINSTTLGVKNNTATTKIASVNVLLGTV